MMSGKRFLRILLAVPLAMFVVVGLLGYIPASASHMASSANLAAGDQQIFAGGTRTFTLTINHPTIANCGTGLLPTPCPDGVDYIEIVSPDGRGDPKDPTRNFAVQSAATTLSGWTATVVPGSFGNVPRRVRFTTTGDGLLGPGTFTVNTTVPILGADLSKAWTVKVSSDGGATQTEATGSLTTVVRMLRVTGLALVGPERAVGTGRVTGLQQGIQVACTVENLGSIPISVTPILSSPGFSQTGAPSTTAIPDGGSLTFPPFVLTADNVSAQTNRILTCDANGTSIEGGSTTTSFNNRQLTIPVQPPAIFDYVKVIRPPTFSPRALAPLSTAAFLATLRKNPATSPSVDLDGAATVLHFSNDDATCTLDIPLGTSLTVPAGALASLVLSFGPAGLPACMTAGVYDVTMSLAGIDANGAPVSFPSVPNFEETLTIDAGAPAVENLAIAGVNKPSNFNNMAGVPGNEGYDTIERAAKNNTAVPFSGAVTDNLDSATAERQACVGGPATGSLQPGECRIVEASLSQFSDVEGTLLIPGQTILCPSVTINASGDITGSCTATFDPAARSIRARVDVEDSVGQPGTGNSVLPESSFGGLGGRLQVDNVGPTILRVETQRYLEGMEERQNRLVVTLNECVSRQGGTSGGLVSNTSNWMPDNNAVTAVAGPNCVAGSVTVADPDGESIITLTTRDDYADDGPHGSLRYDTSCAVVCDGSSLQDRMSFSVPFGNHTIIDRIAPKVPVIAGVSVEDGRELGLQVGEFFTNTLTPDFHLVNPADQMDRAIYDGYRAEIWEETNGNAGLQMDGANPDDLRGSAVVDGTSDCDPGTGIPGDPEFVNCEVTVGTDFSADHVESGETAVTVYAVTKDTLDASLGGPNLSPTVDEVLNLDFNVPILQSVLPEAGRVLVTFSEALLSGRNFAADWGVWNSSFSDMTVASVGLVAGEPTQRALNISDSAYVPEETGLIEYIYFGPETGAPDAVRYEDRATNKTVTPQAVCLPAGASGGLC